VTVNDPSASLHWEQSESGGAYSYNSRAGTQDRCGALDLQHRSNHIQLCDAGRLTLG